MSEITVRKVRAFLDSLPEEFQDSEFTTVFASYPVTLKRVIAYKSKDGSMIGVCTNGMGSHMPFNDSFEWVKTL